MSDFELPAGSEYKPRKGASLPAVEVEPKHKEEDSVNQDPAAEKPLYSKEELMRIFDDIIFAGEYTEQVTIKGKLKVGFRTRSAAELEEISLMVDGITANLMATLNEKRTILNLQYALTSYQGKDLRLMKTEDRAKFVRSLPGPVIGALINALMKFDQKVYQACQEAEENF